MLEKLVFIFLCSTLCYANPISYLQCNEDYEYFSVAVRELAREKIDLFVQKGATVKELAALETKFFACFQEMIKMNVDVNEVDTTKANPALVAIIDYSILLHY